MSSSLPSADNDYRILDIDTKLTLALWNAVLPSVGTRLRAAEAIRADFEALINLGTGQALEVISANVEPQLAALTATISQLQSDVREAEDVIAALISGSVPMGTVTGLGAALLAKADAEATSAALSALNTLVATKAASADLAEALLLKADAAATNAALAAKADAAGTSIAIASGARGFVNAFRNGGFTVAQRGTSGSVAAGATAYTLDGWQISAGGAAAAWSQVWNTGIAGASLRINRASGLTACTLQQRIESYLSAQLLTHALAVQPVTVQVAVYNGTSAAITPKIATGYASARDNFGTVTANLPPTNLQTIPAGASGIVSYTFVPNVNIANGLQIQLQFGSALNAASGYVQIGRADIRATPGIAVGINSAPPPPETRDPATEKTLAARYYSTVPANLLSNGAAPFGGCVVTVPIQMRAAPTALSVASTSASSWDSPTLLNMEAFSDRVLIWPPADRVLGAYNKAIIELSAEL
ncbi:hypothetical protein [Rhodomicrobium lacus]|uniref:hypothetical protein n=1 Tax=Rhodomicrobium lacus TaxID=2498452 RepID=UPI000F8CF2F9|nr:hypothetical protein [Rhodomicrobium lacus]